MKSVSISTLLLSVSCALSSAPATADSMKARCDIYPAGEDNLEKMIPCSFTQRQGYITIYRDDDVTHDLEPVGDTTGTFRDQDGRRVYRNSGLGDQGLIFRFPEESVYVYWNTARLYSDESDNPTAPFTTNDYDATARFLCKAPGDETYGSCPGGILRMDNGQASIVVENQAGEQFTINFMTEYVNATNREVEAHLDGDTWILKFANGEVWEVPLAAIEGG